MMRRLVTAFFLAGVAFVVPVSGMGGSEESGLLKVVGTTSIVTDVVTRIAGDSAEVTGLMKSGQDPHSYEPSPRDMAGIESADVVFVNGFDLEEGLLRTLNRVNPSAVVEVSRTVDPLLPEEESDDHEDDHHEDDHHEDDHHEDDHHEEDHHHEGVDPHTWMSPLNVMAWVDVIEETLIQYDPVHRESYIANAARYREELSTLDQQMREEFNAIPREKRLLITDHKTFGYLARDYGFEVAGSLVPGFSSLTEASPREMSSLIDLIKERDIPVVFVGDISEERLSGLTKALKEETDHPLRIQILLTGSLRPSGQPGDSYISFMAYNARQIVRGFAP